MGTGRLRLIDTNGRDIGRIFKPRAGVPADHPWMWTITGAVVAPRLPSHGFCASLDEAKAKFAETWRAWLALYAQDNLSAPQKWRRVRFPGGRDGKGADDGAASECGDSHD